MSAPRQIDLTETDGSLHYVEVLTPGGLVRVNVGLVDTRTGRPVVVVEIEPNIPGRAKTAPGGDWATEVRDHLGFRTDVRLVQRETAATAGEGNGNA